MPTTPFLTIKTCALIAVMACLAACGAGSVKDPFIPTRVVVLGDALSDMTSATTRYTVNDATITNWAEQVASTYGLAAVNIVPLAVGNASIAAVSAQANGFAFQTGDLVLMSAGYRDLIDVAEAAGTQAASVASATTLGTAYANAVRGLVTAGAKHVIALDMYNLAQTPYQTLSPRTAASHPLNLMTRAFNDALKSNLGDSTKAYIGDNVRLGKAEQYMVSVVGSPTGNGFTDATTVTCTSGVLNEIGILGNSLSAKGCLTTTLGPVATALTYNNYVFADPVYLTPAAQRGLGNYVLSGINW